MAGHGASAPAEASIEQFGITCDAIVAEVQKPLKESFASQDANLLRLRRYAAPESLNSAPRIAATGGTYGIVSGEFGAPASVPGESPPSPPHVVSCAIDFDKIVATHRRRFDKGVQEQSSGCRPSKLDIAQRSSRDPKLRNFA